MTAEPSDPLSSLHDPIVRDLAWVLSSPPLLTPATPSAAWPGTTVYQELLAAYDERLRSLDLEPSPLHSAVSEQRSGRIGHYFEALWRFWLQDNPDYVLRAHNVQIRSGGDTLGELDLLVQDTHGNELQHWELAIKFYLGHGDTGDLSAWIGPNAQDRLDHKLQRLLGHQLPLLQHPATQTLLKASGLDIGQQRIVMKGRLFYPVRDMAPAPAETAQDHLRGWWTRNEDFYAYFADRPLRWLPLTRQHWLAPLRRTQAAELLTAAQLSHRLRDISRPVCVAGFAENDECTRGFIVPASWPFAEQRSDV